MTSDDALAIIKIAYEALEDAHQKSPIEKVHLGIKELRRAIDRYEEIVG